MRLWPKQTVLLPRPSWLTASSQACLASLLAGPPPSSRWLWLRVRVVPYQHAPSQLSILILWPEQEPCMHACPWCTADCYQPACKSKPLGCVASICISRTLLREWDCQLQPSRYRVGVCMHRAACQSRLSSGLSGLVCRQAGGRLASGVRLCQLCGSLHHPLPHQPGTGALAARLGAPQPCEPLCSCACPRIRRSSECVVLAAYPRNNACSSRVAVHPWLTLHACAADPAQDPHDGQLQAAGPAHERLPQGQMGQRGPADGHAQH